MEDTCAEPECIEQADCGCSAARCSDCCDELCGGECVRAVKVKLDPEQRRMF